MQRAITVLRVRILIPFFLLTCFGLMLAVLEAGEKVQEIYSATLLNTSGGRSKTVSIKMYIYSYTSDEEVQKLAEALKSGGAEALSKALDKTERGRIAPSGGTGNDINLVRVADTEKGRLIRLVANRPIGFIELTRGGRSADYEFGMIELLVDKEGKGEGSIIGAAQIRFGEANKIEVESLGTQSLRLMNIRRQK